MGFVDHVLTKNNRGVDQMLTKEIGGLALGDLVHVPCINPENKFSLDCTH